MSELLSNGSERVDFWNLTARRCFGKPDKWQWCQLDRHNAPEDYVRVTGAVPDGVYKSGPRKGRPRWPTDVETIWIRKSQFDQTRRIWESENGLCGDCQGEKRTVRATRLVAGKPERTYQVCKRCGGTGAPVVDATQETLVETGA